MRSWMGSGFMGALLAMAFLCSAARADLIDYSGRFPNNPPDLTFNGTARVRLSYAELTHGGGEPFQAGSVFSNLRCNIRSFSTTFTLRLHDGFFWPYCGGITFAIQGNSPTALGPAGGALGYGSVDATRWPCINHGVAIKFDLWDDEGEGDNSTGRSFTCSYTIDIPAFVGDDTAYVGFTGATGPFGTGHFQDIRTWRFESPDGQGSACPAEFGPGIRFP